MFSMLTNPHVSLGVLSSLLVVPSWLREGSRLSYSSIWSSLAVVVQALLVQQPYGRISLPIAEHLRVAVDALVQQIAMSLTTTVMVLGFNEYGMHSVIATSRWIDRTPS